MTATFTRRLGRSGIEVSGLGLGCWAIGGPLLFDGRPAGWSQVDDDESIRALRRGHELGVTFFDTAANYGAGHSERILGRAFAGHRADVVIVTKFGHQIDEQARRVTGYDGGGPDADVASRLPADVEASLRRLGTDYLDVYLLHPGDLSIERALAVRDVLDDLVAQGKVRTYGWSTDREDAVRAFATTPGCGVVEQNLNVFEGDLGLLAACEELDLGSINRGPLGMGLLTGKFGPDTRFPADDVRSAVTWSPAFSDGRPTKAWLDRLDAVRDVLTSDGRTLTQGALAWIWARSPVTVPIPGFKTVQQVQDISGALATGPLTPAQLAEIDVVLGRLPVG